jgi:hypothetical protein
MLKFHETPDMFRSPIGPSSGGPKHVGRFMKFLHINVCEYVLEFHVLKHETQVQVVGFYFCVLILARYKNGSVLTIAANK